MLDVAPPIIDSKDGLKSYYVTKIEELQLVVSEKTQNLRRLQAQRNELNAKGKMSMSSLSFISINLSHIIIQLTIFKSTPTKIKTILLCANCSPYAT